MTPALAGGGTYYLSIAEGAVVGADADANLAVSCMEITAADATAPLATDASFTDATPGAAPDDVFGDQAGDVITVTYDETMAAPGDGDTVTLDADGDLGTIADQTTYTCDNTAGADQAGEVTCALVGGNQITFTTSNATATNTTITNGVSDVEGTGGITDRTGNAAGGYPELIN